MERSTETEKKQSQTVLQLILILLQVRTLILASTVKKTKREFFIFHTLITLHPLSSRTRSTDLHPH